MLHFKKLLLLSTLFSACQTGKLDVIADLPNSLKEASAIEKIETSDLLWTIEDSGNKNTAYGLNTKGQIVKTIRIGNSNNIDWEDLTSDKLGNLYIGDFGNNSKNRGDFTIYKILNSDNEKTNAQRINFVLPKKVKPKDFEAFFLLNNVFYIFSKGNKSALFKVPNKVGRHTAIKISEFKFKGKHNRITAADVSDDGKTIVLLNHDKLWKITHFKNDNFFEGHIQELKFDHNSQKEGVCFKTNNTVYITDEKTKGNGGNLYEFKLY
jgi:hypothetical protein